MTPEGRVKSRVREVLRKHGVYWHCPVQNGMGAPSLDFVCAAAGRYLAIETKAGSKQPTARQEVTITQIKDAGGTVFVVNEKSGTGELESWLLEVSK